MLSRVDLGSVIQHFMYSCNKTLIMCSLNVNDASGVIFNDLVVEVSNVF